jgi:hypothetical protein
LLAGPSVAMIFVFGMAAHLLYRSVFGGRIPRRRPRVHPGGRKRQV